jgi:hypothetical protein
VGLRERVFFVQYYYFLERYFSELLTLKVEAILVTNVVAVVGEGSLRYSAVAEVGGSSVVVVVVGRSSAVVLVVGGSSTVVVVVVIVFWRRISCSESVLWTTNCPLVLACCGLGTAITFCGHFYFRFKVYFLCLIKYTHDCPHLLPKG